MTKSFAIIFTVLTLSLLSIVWAQLINVNDEEEKITTATALLEAS